MVKTLTVLLPNNAYFTSRLFCSTALIFFLASDFHDVFLIYMRYNVLSSKGDNEKCVRQEEIWSVELRNITHIEGSVSIFMLYAKVYKLLNILKASKQPAVFEIGITDYITFIVFIIISEVMDTNHIWKTNTDYK